ncbi:MAG: alpha-mannosidase, partial [Ilumatobacteraceae bacterium]
MHDNTRLIIERVERELSQWVAPALYSESLPLHIESWDVTGEPVSYDEALRATFAPFDVGSLWGRPWGTTWFRFRGTVPQAWVGPRLEANIDLGFRHEYPGFQAEGLLWSAGGPVQGIHPRRRGVPLPELSGGPFELVVEAAANPLLIKSYRSPLGSLATAGTDPLYRLERAALCLRDDTVFGLMRDVEVLLGMAKALPSADGRRQRTLHALERAFDTLDLRNITATAKHGRDALAPALDRRAGDGTHRVIAVGHAHIDTAWLWPIRESIRKCARSFSSAVRLMDDYPEYQFLCSQAVHYAWMEEHYPELFERIRKKVESGQFQPVGGMWVEPDMNLPSGESIVRQFVLGQRYFESRFGIRNREVWIPDVFGYPASLPQIFRAAGCDRFVTQKLRYNRQNRFPHHTFWWEGIDGSRVLTHFPPVDTYNANLEARESIYADANFQDHFWSDTSVIPYGHGDGGGGPTREML